MSFGRQRPNPTDDRIEDGGRVELEVKVLGGGAESSKVFLQQNDAEIRRP